MTYGSDINDPHGHNDPHSHPEEEAGAWHGDQPPVDDFSDSAHGGEEGATVSEDMGLSDHAEGEEAPKPKSKILPMLVAVIGLLAAGGGLYMHFGKNPMGGMPMTASAPPPAPAPAAAPTTGSMVDGTGSEKVPGGSVADASANGGGNDTAPMLSPSKAEEQIVPPPTQSAPVPPPATAGPVPDTDLGKIPTEDEAANLLPPLNGADTVPPILEKAVTPPTSAAPKKSLPTLPTPTQVAPVTPVVPVAPVAPIVAAPSVPDERMAALSARVNELERLLSQTSQQLSEVTTENAKTKELNARISKLEKELAQQRHVKVAQERSQDTVPDEPFYAASPSPVKAERPRHVEPHHKAAPKVVKKQAPVVPRWVIRAAIPNEAWVARDANTSELQHVKVGDTLSGIGQITAIRQKAGQWNVIGTQGILTH